MLQGTQQQVGHMIPPQTPPDQFSNPSDSLSSQMTQSSSPRNSCETDPQYGETKRKRPSSNYFNQKTSSEKCSQMRQQVQLRLIEEVNNQKQINNHKDFDRDEDQQVIPREGNIGLRSSLIDYNSSATGYSEGNQNGYLGTKKTRAQAVPMAQRLSSVFNSSYGKCQNMIAQQTQDFLAIGQQIDNLNYQAIGQKQPYFSGSADQQRPDFYGHDDDDYEAQQNIASPRNSANSMIANELNEGAQMLPQSVSKSPQVLIQRTQRNFDLADNRISNIHPEPLHQNLVNNANESNQPNQDQNTPAPPKQARPPTVIEPRSIHQPVERQIKYLGLVIEKDEEYQLQEDDIQVMRYQKQNGCISRFSAKELEQYESQEVDSTKRQYFPIRDRYIKIVKNSRKLSIESFEKRGRKDLKQTSRSLIKVARSQRRQNSYSLVQKQMEQLTVSQSKQM